MLPTLGPILAQRLTLHTRTASMRVEVQGGGCSGMQYRFLADPEPASDDFVVTTAGARLFIDPVSAPWLENALVEWSDGPTGQSVQVRNPNAASSCGCGQSFAPRD